MNCPLLPASYTHIADRVYIPFQHHRHVFKAQETCWFVI